MHPGQQGGSSVGAETASGFVLSAMARTTCVYFKLSATLHLLVVVAPPAPENAAPMVTVVHAPVVRLNVRLPALADTANVAVQRRLPLSKRSGLAKIAHYIVAGAGGEGAHGAGGSKHVSVFRRMPRLPARGPLFLAPPPQ